MLSLEGRVREIIQEMIQAGNYQTKEQIIGQISFNQLLGQHHRRTSPHLDQSSLLVTDRGLRD